MIFIIWDKFGLIYYDCFWLQNILQKVSCLLSSTDIIVILPLIFSFFFMITFLIKIYAVVSLTEPFFKESIIFFKDPIVLLLLITIFYFLFFMPNYLGWKQSQIIRYESVPIRLQSESGLSGMNPFRIRLQSESRLNGANTIRIRIRIIYWIWITQSDPDTIFDWC